MYVVYDENENGKEKKNVLVMCDEECGRQNELERMMDKIGVVLWLIFIVNPFKGVHSNTEGDSLYKLRQSLKDPRGAMSSWDPTLVNPCTWEHITCVNNAVTRM
ncbi:BRI1-associated receptor kinase [Striga asiatica]|uniref:BRI1-associated receptor kinase n=1 Tax=Striga asiatica TaxID=4170 RepID=A0A5A7Q957_STRAF|nr:BRI1-associated receptor kinase [Striga asiatica]